MRYLFLIIVCFVFFVKGNAQSFNLYLSNSGNDNNAGTTPAKPKKTFAGAFAPQAGLPAMPGIPIKIGLQSGNIFNESFEPLFPVNISTYFDDSTSKDFAVLNGTDRYDEGWEPADSNNIIYKRQVPLTGFKGYGINGLGQYSFVFVFEIDRELEKKFPITARRMLSSAISINKAISTPGSFYNPADGDLDNYPVYIHTSDGLSPNNHPRYRYEISVRAHAINSTYQEGNHFENLWVRGYGAGNGMLPSGANSFFKRVIFGPGAGIHHLVLRGAEIDHSLFLPAAKNTNSYAVVFYDDDGQNRCNVIKNSIFLDVSSPIYTHYDHGTNFASLTLQHVFSFASLSNNGPFLGTRNTDSVIMDNVNCYNHTVGYQYGWAKYLSIKNSAFVNVDFGIAHTWLNAKTDVNNSFIKVDGRQNKIGVFLTRFTNFNLAHSIIHLSSNKSIKNSNNYGGAFISRESKTVSNVSNNIFICEVDTALVGYVTDHETGDDNRYNKWDNNVYILASGKDLLWRVWNKGHVKYVSFKEWKNETGNDKNSIFIDIRNEPDGLRKIFSDPEHGDYAFANTLVAKWIASSGAGMTSPISCFVKKPTYEEAAALIMNGGLLEADICRSPCIQNAVRGGVQLSIRQLPVNKVALAWKLPDQRGVVQYQLSRSFNNGEFKPLALIDPTDDTVYNFIDETARLDGAYSYRVEIISKTGDHCYSNSQIINAQYVNANIGVYPNPSNGKFNLLLNDYVGRCQVSITDLSGRLLYTKEIIANAGMRPSIELKNIPRGAYWLKIETEGNVIVKQVQLQ